MKNDSGDKSKTIEISVIVCTKDRVDDLKKFLHSLNHQQMLPDELLIIDSSDSDETCNLIANTVSSVPYTTTYIRSEKGLTKQRNLGVAKSCGQYLFFFDDDIILEPDYIKVVYNTFCQYSGQNIGGIAGKISNVTPKRDLAEGLFKKLFFLTTLGNGKLKASGFPAHRMDNQASFVEVVCGGTVAYTREVFSTFNFDEKLAGYSYMEDVDFSYRVSRKHRLLYQPQARLAHYATTYKNANSRILRRMMIQNHSYIFRKNISQDYYHLYAHLASVLGIFLYNLLFWKDLPACLGVLEGFWYGTINRQGPYFKDFTKN